MNRTAELPSPPILANSLRREPAAAPAGRRTTRTTYLALLTWAFTLFSSLRAVSYLPTMWAWCTWLGANATMAAWLYEHNGQRLGRAVLVNIGNALMCAVTVALIVANRSWT